MNPIYTTAFGLQVANAVRTQAVLQTVLYEDRMCSIVANTIPAKMERAVIASCWRPSHLMDCTMLKMTLHELVSNP